MPKEETADSGQQQEKRKGAFAANDVDKPGGCIITGQLSECHDQNVFKCLDHGKSLSKYNGRKPHKDTVIAEYNAKPGQP